MATSSEAIVAKGGAFAARSRRRGIQYGLPVGGRRLRHEQATISRTGFMNPVIPGASGVRLGRAAMVLCVLALGACASSDPSPPPAECPAVMLLEGADRTSAYRDGVEPVPGELRYIAGLSELTSSCRYVDEGVEVDLAFTLTAERGPAFSSTPEEVDYFIATLGPDGEILNKQVYPAELDLEEGYVGARWSEQLTLLIRSITAERGPDYTLIVGFQLDDAELARRQQPRLR